MTGYLCDADGVPFNAETFDLDAYLTSIPFIDEALRSSLARRELTRYDPMIWAALYVPHLLKNTDGEITFSDVHLGLYRDALALAGTPGPEGDRRAYIAPRGSGKSTVVFVITTLWLACHHPCFVAAFSSSSTQAIDHLHAVRKELQRNRLIRDDYPDACAPEVKANGNPVADSSAMLLMRNGFSFSARGIDTEVLGLVDPLNRRPAVIYLDDIEGAEGSGYSRYQADQRRTTIVDGILPMNNAAHVRLIGTVTIPGGLVHQLVKYAVFKEDPEPWITDERFKVTYFPPIITRDDGTERSTWPGKWPIEFLQSIRHTRSFAKNYANQPMDADGIYWVSTDFRYGTLDTITRTGLWVDPAVTTKSTSDFTGLAVVSYSGVERKCVIRKALGVRLAGKELRLKVIGLLEEFPEITRIFVEVNQGGDLWVTSVFHNLAVKVVPHTVSVSKEVRFAQALPSWQRGRVLHAERLDMLEEQATAFPRGQHDDVIDAAVSGVIHFLHPTPRVRSRVDVESYV